MNHIEIRKIAAHNIVVTADETGTVYINGERTSEPVTTGGESFVWAPKQAGLPPGTKIALTDTHLAAIKKHGADFKAAQQARAKLAREYNDVHNEGGEGFNPYLD